MLKSENSPTKAAPTRAACAFCASLNCAKPTEGSPNSLPPKVSCSIGEAAPMMPMPAETLRHSTAQISQNCRVLWAFLRSTCPVVIMALALVGGVQPSGRQAATTPAFRGPTRSSQPPQMAAEVPSSTKNSVNIQPRSNCVQSQEVVNSACAVMATLPEEGSRVARANDWLAGSGSDAKGATERHPEHAEAIGHADAEMDGESCRRYEPAVVV